MRVLRHLSIAGQVQGVGFRYFVAQQVLRFFNRKVELEGWVRNRRDGTVEAVIAGESYVVAEMIAACRKGPTGATVIGIEEREANPAELDLRLPDQPFSILPDA